MQTGKGKEPLWKDAAAELAKNREAFGRLARSGEARNLMAMLQQQGGVQEAAQAAAGGDPGRLMEMMNRLLQSPEGAQLAEQIGRQAKKEGLQ